MTFWIITAALAFGISVLMALALLRGRVGDAPPAAYDLKVYRAQLAEVDKDLARGVISAEDGERTKAEISRRILAADAQIRSGGDTGGQPAGAGVVLAVVTTLFLVGGTYALYLDLGAPGYGDLALSDRLEMAEETRRNRPSQAEAEDRYAPQLAAQVPTQPVSDDYTDLMAKLRSAVAERPDDLQGQRLLARNEIILGNYVAARRAQEQVITLLGTEATAGDLIDLADLMLQTTGGYVSPEAEALLGKVLEKDPQNPVARYYLGLMFVQVGRPDATFRLWSALLTEGPATAPWITPIRAQIPEVARMAGVRYTLPPLEQAPGPDADQLRAAQEMSEAERNEMIRGMVSGLSERLATEGGTPAEWARLITAYGVLGELAQAQAIYQEARQVFTASPEALQMIETAAENAGLRQ